jgi:hypothetical protein
MPPEAYPRRAVTESNSPGFRPDAERGRGRCHARAPIGVSAIRAPWHTHCPWSTQVKAMSNAGWSWSLRLVVALAVAVATWVGAATLALGALQQHANVAVHAPPAPHR